MKIINQKRKYSKISLRRRQKLIKLITEKNYTVVRAARSLSLNPQTARLIYIQYLETGLFYGKRPPKVKYNIKDKTSEQYIQDNVRITKSKQISPAIFTQNIPESVFDPQSANMFEPNLYIWYYMPTFPSFMSLFT